MFRPAIPCRAQSSPRQLAGLSPFGISSKAPSFMVTGRLDAAVGEESEGDAATRDNGRASLAGVLEAAKAFRALRLARSSSNFFFQMQSMASASFYVTSAVVRANGNTEINAAMIAVD
ncbi:hypothetical protein BHE74_00027457 [Ensete ventricosum]|nr:hypothetical protein GW17_00008866 [Ensete ventricosum]RWW65251.1 hypothetical protein BHE74_00027457 [Ensete ventricosum]RZR99338.1 hypothetical protein BHM03_00028857 [Ensete ventricosum]